MSTAIIVYLYLAGVLNGSLIIGLDRELTGEMPRATKAIFATLLWPILFPWLWLPRSKP